MNFKEYITEGLKYNFDIHGKNNKYVGLELKVLERKLKSFNLQLADLQRKNEIGTDEYNEKLLQIKQVQYAIYQIEK